MAVQTHTIVSPGSSEYQSQAMPVYTPPPNVYSDLVQVAAKVGINSYQQLKAEKKQGDMASFESEKIRINADYQGKLRQASSESEVNHINDTYKSKLGTFISSSDFDSSTKLSMTNNLKKVSAGWYADGKARMSTVYAKTQMANKAEMIQTVIASGDIENVRELVTGKAWGNYFNNDAELEMASKELISKTVSSNFNQSTLQPMREQGVNPALAEATGLSLMQSIESSEDLSLQDKQQLTKNTKSALKDATNRFTAISNVNLNKSINAMEESIANGTWNEATKEVLKQQYNADPYATAQQKQYLSATADAGAIAMNNPFVVDDVKTLNSLVTSFTDNGMTTSQRLQATVAINLLPNEQDRMIASNKLNTIPLSLDDPKTYRAGTAINQAIDLGEMEGKKIYEDQEAFNETQSLIFKLPIGATEKRKTYNKLLEGQRAHDKLSKDVIYKNKVEPYLKMVTAPLPKLYKELREIDEDKLEKIEEKQNEIQRINDKRFNLINLYNGLSDSEKQNPNLLSMIGATEAKVANASAMAGMNNQISEGGKKKEKSFPAWILPILPL